MIKINGNEVERECDMCGGVWHIELENDELDGLLKYLEGGNYIQDCLPTLNKCEREFIKSGHCAECQRKLFGNGYTKRLY